MELSRAAGPAAAALSGSAARREESAQPGSTQPIATASAAFGLCAPRRLLELLEEIGEVPLPPYIRRSAATERDAERYQTVFARAPGRGRRADRRAALHAGAVSTCSAARASRSCSLTLHVGPGTFLPVRERAARRSIAWRRSASRFPEPTARPPWAARQARGRRVVAVGTTTVRALEAAAAIGDAARCAGEVTLFIVPGYRFASSTRCSRTFTCRARRC